MKPQTTKVTGREQALAELRQVIKAGSFARLIDQGSGRGAMVPRLALDATVEAHEDRFRVGVERINALCDKLPDSSREVGDQIRREINDLEELMVIIQMASADSMFELLVGFWLKHVGLARLTEEA